MPDHLRLRAALASVLSLTLDAALWLVNLQMFALIALGQLVRRLDSDATR